MLSFLDVLITRHNGNFSTSVYRNSAYTGLGTHFLSFSPLLYKTNSIRTLINRAYNVCATFNLFHAEMSFLLDFFTLNAYPANIFHKILRVFLNDKFEPKPI